MTIAQSLQLAVKSLNENRIDSPRLESELLLSHILKKPREFLLAHGEKKLSSSQAAKFKSLTARRLKGEPIAYLTGRKEFYGLNFKVNKNVLIPRPETELMVEEALRLTARNPQPCPSGRRAATLVDVGTGSGCIIITLAKKISNRKFFATDISTKALTVAKQNAKLHGVAKNIKFIKGNLLEPSLKILDSRLRGNDKKIELSSSDLIITANLPYGWPAWKNNSSTQTIGLKFEPEIALYAGKHGLEIYEKLFKQIQELRVTGCVLCEIDPRQAAEMEQLIRQYLPQAKFQIKKDLSGLNRLAIIEIK